VPILSKRPHDHLRKKVTFETSCVYSKMYVFLRHWKKSWYLLLAVRYDEFSAPWNDDRGTPKYLARKQSLCHFVG